MSRQDGATDFTARTIRAKASAAGFGKFYTIEQIAECVEASTRTVRRWVKRKLLIAHKINGMVRVSEADFRAFLAAHRDQ